MFSAYTRKTRIYCAAGFLLGSFVLWAAIMLSLDATRDRILERIANDQHNLARSLAANVTSSFRPIDLALLHLRETWVRDRAGFAAAVAREVAFLKREAIMLVSVVDAGGRIVWSNLAGWQPADVTDRAYFQAHKAGGDALHISEPMIGRVSGQSTIQFTRAVLSPRGQFAGVVVISVPPLALEKTYDDIRLAEGGNISLVRADGHFLARSRNFSAAAAAVLPVAETPGLRPGDPIAGGSRRINAIEKVDSFVSYYKVTGYPAVVYVREPADRLLAGYYAQRRVFLAGGFLGSALLLWLSLLIHAKARDRNLSELSSARLSAIVANANDAIIGRTLDGKVTSWNAAAERLFGYTAAEIIGKHGLLTPPGLAEEAERNRHWLAGGRPVPPYETVRIAKGGRRIDVSFSASPIRNEAGEVVGMANIVRDISERKRADEARARLAAIVESAGDAIIGRTLDGKITSWNTAAERMFGYTFNEIHTYADRLTPPDRLEETARNRRLIREGKPIPAYETVRVTKDGRRIDVLLSGSPVKNERGEIIGMATVFRDNTERKMIEDTLRFLAQNSARGEVVELFRPLSRYLAGILKMEFVCVARLDAAAASVRTLSLYIDGDFHDNTSFPLAGTPCAEVIKQESLALPSDVSLRFPADPKLRQFNAASYIGVTLRGADGKPMGLIAAMGRLPLANTGLAESILKLVGVRVEGELEHELMVESLRRSEGELARLNAELEQIVERRTADLKVINEELESFSYSVAHDLRAPLRAIGGFSAMVLARNEKRLDETSVGHLGRIKTNAERMAELIDDLLNLTRVSRQQIHRIDFDLSAAAEKISAALAEAHPQRRVETVIEQGMKVHADPGLVRVLLDNLIGNAWKFSAAANPARIEVGSLIEDGETTYFVRDNGAGFDMTYAGKLFAPFQRLHGREEFEGTGIGLSIVRRVAMKHGGRVRAEGSIGGGATFYFTLGAARD